MWNSDVLCAGGSAGNIEHLLCDTQYTANNVMDSKIHIWLSVRRQELLNIGNKADGT
jgi:hypothetical protein